MTQIQSWLFFFITITFQFFRPLSGQTQEGCAVEFEYKQSIQMVHRVQSTYIQTESTL